MTPRQLAGKRRSAKRLAEKLAGCRYWAEIDIKMARAAANRGLVVVFGSSDYMEFRGAIYAEIRVYGCKTVTVDAIGILPEFREIVRGHDKDELRDYYKREGFGKTISAIRDQDGYVWTYKTDIPHKTFEVIKDGDPYCRGIVFSMGELS